MLNRFNEQLTKEKLPMSFMKNMFTPRWTRFYEKFRRKYLYKAFVRNDQDIENERRLNDPIHLDRFGYKVYSQHDEDGIICEIFNRIGTTNKTFVEFGVQDGLESNSHYLLFNGWNGLWIEGSKAHFKRLNKIFNRPISENRLAVISGFITAENINDIIGSKIKGPIDLLSIDIDGNDYWVWKAINCISPRVVVIEFNAKFPPPCEWVMKYNPRHIWDGSDKHGASLKSFELLGSELGYRLVGTNTNGTNAFFVKREEARNLFPEPADAENLFHTWGRRFIAGGHPVKEYIGK